MAVLTVNTISRAGANLTTLATAAAVAGDSWQNSGGEFLAVINGSGSSITVTLTYTGTLDSQSVTGRTVTVPAGATVSIGPFPANLYNDASLRAGVTMSSVTSVSVAVFRLGA